MKKNQKISYHYLSQEETLKEFKTDAAGLPSEEAKKRQDEFGKNTLPQKETSNPWMLFIKQFKDVLIFILLIAGGVAFWADKMVDVYIILAVILFNAVLGFVQEYKAEKAIKAIKGMIQKDAFVLRDKKETTVAVEEVVPGDIMVLKEGKTIPADGRLIQVKGLRTDEASLTGESMPIDKTTEETEEDAPLGDRTNMVWKSTNVVKGSGKAVVTTIGKETQIGQIAHSMGEMKKQDSNFKKKTAKLGKQMGAIAIVTSAIVFIIGYWFRDFEFQEILLFTIATLVSSIPEGLPAVISIVLAIGASRMAKQNVIVREFTATEMMGSISVILSDKTGTITQSILTVTKIFTGSEKETVVTGEGYQLDGEFRQNDKKLNLKEHPIEEKLLAIATFCNNARLEDKKENAPGDQPEKNEDKKNSRNESAVIGDPTEAAMYVLGEKARIKEKDLFQSYKILDDLPFNSDQKFRASLVETKEGKEFFIIGAPERILELSTHWLTPEGRKKMSPEKKEAINHKMDEWAGQALRVLAVAYDPSANKDSVEPNDLTGLTWAGITGIIDPPRENVAQSIAECKTAGIRVIMVTGDHKITAAAIAEQIGILDKKEEKQDQQTKSYPAAMTSKELDVDDEQFDDYIRHVSVFARMDPMTKLRIAERFQEKETLIAMTGDGVNDAPALKRADVGIAMGQRGTDVTKDAADIVLQDDNFSSIVNAIKEGRIVFNNVKITSYFLLTTNFAFVSVIIISMGMGMPLILTAVQILYTNLVTDGIMDVALSTEPGHGDIMKQPPVNKNASILAWDIMPYILIMAAIMVAMALFTFTYYESVSEEMARTATFVVISMTQIWNAFNMRSIRLSLFEIGPLTNVWVNLAFVIAIVLQFAVIKVPFLREAMGFSDFPTVDFIVIGLVSSVILWIGELYKYLRYKKGMF